MEHVALLRVAVIFMLRCFITTPICRRYFALYSPLTLRYALLPPLIYAMARHAH